MGITHHRDALTSRYVTALIMDHNRRAWLVPIKHAVGHYFLADLNHNLYAFSLLIAVLIIISAAVILYVVRTFA